MKLAIFDIDGTLTNTNSVDDVCFVKALVVAHNISDVNTDWSAYDHTTDSGITRQIFQEKFGRDPETSELEKLKSCFVSLLRREYDSNVSSFLEIAGAKAMLERLRQEPEWTTAIATGSWRDSAELKLKAAKIPFDGIPAAFAEDGLAREEILQWVVSKALASYHLGGFEKVVSIGDGIWDVRTARRLNFAFVGVGSADKAATLNRAGAKHVIEAFVDYQRLVSFLNSAEVPVAPE